MFADPKGSLPVLQYCLPGQLQIDPSYQREIDDKGRALVRKIAASWDWSLCQPLVVASRSDRSLFVIDGQHRLEAARARGDIAQLPCVILYPADPAEEAAAFVELNANRRPLTHYALYNAALAAGDEVALRLDGLLMAAGLRFSGAADVTRLKPGQLNNVGTVRKWHARYGDERTRIVLTCLARAFDGQVLKIAGPLFSGIASVALEHGEHLSTHLFVDVLQLPQDDWLAEFRQHAAAAGVGVQAAAVAVLRAAYLEAAAE